MKDTKYLVVITYTAQSYGEEYNTIEEARKEMLQEMKKYTSPNYSFQIMRINYENCTSDMWNERSNNIDEIPFKE